MSGRTESGSATVELVLMTPVLVALLLFIVLVGRLGAARGTVDAAARDAARAASTANGMDDARRAALAAGRASTHTDGLTCRPLTVTVAGDVAPGGTVIATVSCVVPLGDLTAGLSIPGAQTLTARFAAPVDPYRSTR